jgi:hypothetical protein
MTRFTVHSLPLPSSACIRTKPQLRNSADSHLAYEPVIVALSGDADPL